MAIVGTSRRFHSSEGVDGDYVLRYMESHTEVQDLSCDGTVSDEYVQAMDRLFITYHSAIHLHSLELPRNGLTAAAGASLAHILHLQRETLQKLDISHNPLTAVGLKDLIQPLLHNPTCQLTKLDLTATQLGSKGAMPLATLLRHNTSIQELYLGHNHLGTRGMKTLAPRFASNCYLQILVLSYNKLKARGATLLAQALQASKDWTLQVLDVAANHMGMTGMQAFGELLVLDRRLQGFYVGSNDIGEQGAAHLASVLRYNYTLQDLRMGDNQIGVVGALVLIEELTSNNTTLERLELDWNGLGPEGALAFAETLQQNSKLSHIDLSGNRIGSEGVVALAESLRYNSTLQELVLKHNYMDDMDAFALTMALGSPSCTVKTVNWQDNSFTEEGLASLQRIPQLKCNYERWLGQLLKDLAKGNVANINLLQKKIANEEVLLLASEIAEHRPLIRSLYLGGSAITARSIVPLANFALASPSNIVRLYLRQIELDDEAISALAKALQRNMTTEILCLTDCSITAKGAKIIASDGLKNNSTLRRLNLDRNAIGDEGLASIAACLPHHVTLNSISACYNDITDKSMSLENLKLVDELHLNGNHITDRGALDFCRSLMDGSHLAWLGLRYNQITHKGGTTIQNFLPDNAVVEY
jgi:Ran GTPase-activating protein (RanGAP) involved in mRNA processing and transport